MQGFFFRPRITGIVEVVRRVRIVSVRCMRRPRWPRHVEEQVWEAGGGKCHHCGNVLTKTPRKGWHIDHFPVAFRDIEDQCCWGVTDALDVSNLVVSCPPCNMSHTFESTQYCGKSQIPCKKRWGNAAALFLSGALCGFATMVMINVTVLHDGSA